METMWLATSIVWLTVLAIVLLVANLVLTFLVFIRRTGGPADQQGPPQPPQPPPDIEETPQGQGLRGKLEAVINLLIRKNTFTTDEINQEVKRIRGK